MNNLPAQDVAGDIIARLERIEAGVNMTNGRVKALEDWQAEHQPWSEQGRDLINAQSTAIASLRQEHTAAIGTLRAEMATLLDRVATPAAIEAAVASALDERALLEDARRWRQMVTGAKAVGWKGLLALATTAGSMLAGALLTLALFH